RAAVARFDARTAASDDALARWRPALHGGDARRGGRIVREHAVAMCIRCHTVEGQGGAAGPPLDGIGSRHDREYLLAALVTPNRDIAAGYELVVVTLADGRVIAGSIASETDTELRIVDGTGASVVVAPG